MRFAILFLSALSTVRAFQTFPSSKSRPDSCLASAKPNDYTREAFLHSTVVAVAVGVLWQEPAHARGRATLEKSYQRYVPRITAGGQFYGGDLRKMVERSDWVGIKNALQEVPDRKKEDLQKSDAGVAERARQAGQFSESRVVVAADLFAGAFSDNSISAKTKKMKSSVEKLTAAVEGMRSVAKQALGEEGGGGFFGFGAKKPSETELAKKMREYYILGGNAFNEYVYAANDDLALQFNKLPYIGG